MKSFTLASITAMVSMYTQAFALEYYSCNGKHINYFILVDYVALMYNKLCERNGASYSSAPGPNTAQISFSYKFDYPLDAGSDFKAIVRVEFDNSKNILEVIAATGAETYICYPVD